MPSWRFKGSVSGAEAPDLPPSAWAMSEGGDYSVIDAALERRGQPRQGLQPLPPPGFEFGLAGSAAGMAHVDLAVGSGEAEGEPFLRLAAMIARPALARDLGWDVVGIPVGRLGEERGRGDVCLLEELALCGVEGRLARIYAALRHLPFHRRPRRFRARRRDNQRKPTPVH